MGFAVLLVISFFIGDFDKFVGTWSGTISDSAEDFEEVMEFAILSGIAEGAYDVDLDMVSVTFDEDGKVSGNFTSAFSWEGTYEVNDNTALVQVNKIYGIDYEGGSMNFKYIDDYILWEYKTDEGKTVRVKLYKE